jgi:hypothetical protein
MRLPTAVLSYVSHTGFHVLVRLPYFRHNVHFVLDKRFIVWYLALSPGGRLFSSESEALLCAKHTREQAELEIVTVHDLFSFPWLKGLARSDHPHLSLLGAEGAETPTIYTLGPSSPCTPACVTHTLLT